MVTLGPYSARSDTIRRNWFVHRTLEGRMSASARPEGHNHQAAMDQLHADVYRHHMAPFWAIDKSNKNDEDNQLRDKRKAIPFIWKYKSDIEPLLLRSAELINR